MQAAAAARTANPNPNTQAMAKKPRAALSIMGVPEHFNVPFQLAEEQGRFAAAGVDVSFKPVPAGSGAMIAALKAKETDVAVVLTEAAVAAIAKEKEASLSPIALCGIYVASPLRWMIASAGGGQGSHITSIDSIRSRVLAEGKTLRIGVSRIGSGSHLMACVFCLQQGLSLDKVRFLPFENFRNLRAAVNSSHDNAFTEQEEAMGMGCDIFMWEWFMTMPFVVAGELAAVGFVDTPWPCFAFAARKDWLESTQTVTNVGSSDQREGDESKAAQTVSNRAVLVATADALFNACQHYTGPSNKDASCSLISALFGLSMADSASWLAKVRFPTPIAGPMSVEGSPLLTPVAVEAKMKAGRGALQSPLAISKQALELAFETLTKAGVLPAPVDTGGAKAGFDPAATVDSFCCRLILDQQDSTAATAATTAIASATAMASSTEVLPTARPPVFSPTTAAAICRHPLGTTGSATGGLPSHTFRRRTTTAEALEESLSAAAGGAPTSSIAVAALSPGKAASNSSALVSSSPAKPPAPPQLGANRALLAVMGHLRRFGGAAVVSGGAGSSGLASAVTGTASKGAGAAAASPPGGDYESEESARQARIRKTPWCLHSPDRHRKEDFLALIGKGPKATGAAAPLSEEERRRKREVTQAGSGGSKWEVGDIG